MKELAKVEMAPLANVEEAKEYLLGSFRQFTSIVRDKKTAQRYFGIAIHCLEQVPRLMECPRSSFRNALLESARLDLEPNSVQQLCWIVPRAQVKGGRPIARLEVGYRGLAQLVFRDGAVRKVWAMAVDEADEFIRREGSEQVLIHNPANQHREGTVKTMVAAYACAKLENGEVMRRVMDRGELECARKLSNSSAYNGPFAMEMYLKTPLKRLCKILPLRTQGRRVAETIDMEDEKHDIAPEPVAVEVAEVQEKTDVTSQPVDGTSHPTDGTSPAPKSPTALPQETRAEVNARILRTWEHLLDLDKIPRLTTKPFDWYVGKEITLGEMREFADYLAREMLKAERRIDPEKSMKH